MAVESSSNRARLSRSSPPASGRRAAASLLHLLVVCVLAQGCHHESAEAAPATRLELFPVDADVWLPSVEVEARVVGGDAPARCALVRNGTAFDVTLERDGFRRVLPLETGENRVVARCSDSHGRELASETVTYVKRSVAWPLAERKPERQDWLDQAVLYGVVPPLYGEPPLQAVTRALPSLAELGVTALWLSPLAGTLPHDFGYAVTDYFAVRPDYGTSADLLELINRAHELGLKVLLDFVPDHTSTQHPYYRQAERLGTRSHYFHFYQRSSTGESIHYFDWQHLPNLDYQNPEVPEWMGAAAGFWLSRFGVDGFRVDAAWGVAQRNPSFYPWLSQRLSSIRPTALIAEASARDPYYLSHGFDAAYDWTLELGHWAWGEVFTSPKQVAARLADALEQTEHATARPDRVLRFLNNNDTGARFITRHGLGMTRAATVMLLTVPGIPCLFSFDEVGGEFEPYAGLKPPEEPRYPELRELHRRLIALRRSEPALRGPALTLLDSGRPDVSMYLRPAPDGGRAVLIVVSWSNGPEKIALSSSGGFGRAKVLVRDLLAPQQPRLSSAQSAELRLEPFGYAILALEQPEPGRAQ